MTSRLLAATLLLALAACASTEGEDLQPIVDSLRTPEMDAAIRDAHPGTPITPAPDPAKRPTT